MAGVFLGTAVALVGFALLGVNSFLGVDARHRGRTTHWLLGWCLNGGGMLAIGAGWMVLATLPPHWDSPLLVGLGAAAGFTGSLLYLASAARVGRWRSLSRYSLDLDTGGPYAQVRHPQALALILLAFGFAGLSGSVALLGSLPLWILCWYGYARLEEKLELVPAFGEGYSEYARRTPCLLPAGLLRSLVPAADRPDESAPLGD
jgi:protein-S-isoprenylcysteine O-methyltransferase Ste14